MSIVIGLTGGYHTGKSTVASFFRENGAKVIDLDEFAHQMLRPSSTQYKKIVKEFGKDIVVANRINRLRLACKVFGNKRRLAKLNAIIHPFVIKKMKRSIASLSKRYRYIVVEAPLLFEAGLRKYFDYIVVVAAYKKKQLERAERIGHCSSADSIKRIDSQIALSYKMKRADFIVDNNGSRRRTRTQVRAIMKQLRGLR